MAISNPSWNKPEGVTTQKSYVPEDTFSLLVLPVFLNSVPVVLVLVLPFSAPVTRVMVLVVDSGAGHEAVSVRPSRC
jgi:hypothetical protein